MKKRKLNYRFHNPNTVEETAELLYKVFLEANEDKVERAIREDSPKPLNNKEYIAEHPA
ncbi:MAG: hypothetical protein MR304_06975 [Eubacterium sp.]|nr:hypothetical protein [Eubacterium sp.]